MNNLAFQIYGTKKGPSSLVTIGTQTWTNTNLDVVTYRDGTPIPEVTNSTAWAALTTGAWCYYGLNSANGPIYGKMYNWHAVNNTANGGLAPLGYHVPTDGDWATLVTYLGGDSVAGGKIKSTGTSLWTSPNQNATNESGFTGLPGGQRRSDGSFTAIGNSGNFWSSLQSGSTTAFYRNLSYLSGNATKTSTSKLSGFSVRLIKD